MVAGDQTRLEIELNPGTRCFVGTQASTKVYRNPQQRPCSHSTRAEVGEGSLLVFAPDAVQAFAGSGYTQRQDFHLAQDASLVLLDWFSSGRSARGERWAFDRFQSRNAIYLRGRPNQVPSERAERPSADELAFLDSVRLCSDDGSLTEAHRTGHFNCFATLLFVGPAVGSVAAGVLAGIAQMPVRRQSSILCSASPVRDGAVLRLAGESVEAVGHELHRQLACLRELLGDDPWARKW
jgi:urease accessory protein